MIGSVRGTSGTHDRLPPGEWVRKHLFSNRHNSVITVVLGPADLIVGFWRFFAFVFVNARWNPVVSNLTLFMIGRFPRTTETISVAHRRPGAIWSGAIGLAWGSGSRRRQVPCGPGRLPYRRGPALTRVERYWASARRSSASSWRVANRRPVAARHRGVWSSGQACSCSDRGSPDQLGLGWWAASPSSGCFGYQMVSGFYGIGMDLAGASSRDRGRLATWYGPTGPMLRRDAHRAILATVHLPGAASCVYTITDLEGSGGIVGRGSTSTSGSGRRRRRCPSRLG